MATVKEKADEWGCSQSTVRNYCTSGLIPPAEKKGMPPRWEIPDGWPRPPMGRHGLCFLLDTICQRSCGAKFESLELGYTGAEVRAAYSYLISSGFMSAIDVDDLGPSLPKARVTTRGTKLIERDNREGKSRNKFKTYLKIEGNVGIASLEAGGEISNG